MTDFSHDRKFLELVNELMDKKFDLKLLKKKHIALNNLCYLTEDQDYIEGSDSRVEDLIKFPTHKNRG